MNSFQPNYDGLLQCILCCLFQLSAPGGPHTSASGAERLGSMLCRTLHPALRNSHSLRKLLLHCVESAFQLNLFSCCGTDESQRVPNQASKVGVG